MQIFNICEQKQLINKNNNKVKKSVNKIREQKQRKEGNKRIFKKEDQKNFTKLIKLKGKAYNLNINDNKILL